MKLKQLLRRRDWRQKRLKELLKLLLISLRRKDLKQKKLKDSSLQPKRRLIDLQLQRPLRISESLKKTQRRNVVKLKRQNKLARKPKLGLKRRD